MKQYKSFSLFFFSITLVIALFASNCLWDSWDDFKKSVNEWQKEEIKKRYGSNHGESQIPEWQEELREYEEVLDEKIKASVSLGKIHRKLGESFAEIGSFEKCIEHLQKSLSHGILETEVFYTLGLCQGNLAQRHNWNYKYAQKAEKTFLKVLNLDPYYEKAKYQLGLIYFYGFRKNNRYRVLNSYITVSQKQYEDKALNLLREYKVKVPDDYRVYFALTNIYKIIGKLPSAKAQMQHFISMIQKKYPDNYQSIKEYKSAIQNLSLLNTQSP